MAWPNPAGAPRAGCARGPAAEPPRDLSRMNWKSVGHAAKGYRREDHQGTCGHDHGRARVARARAPARGNMKGEARKETPPAHRPRLPTRGTRPPTLTIILTRTTSPKSTFFPTR